MTPHDRWLEPDDDSNECDHCDGEGIIINRLCKESIVDQILNRSGTVKCPYCAGTGIYTESGRRQKEFDDFDPPDTDYGYEL